MGETFSEKILAANAKVEAVRPGQIVTARPDVILSHDNSAAISKTFRKTGVSKLADPDSVVIIIDHCVPAAGEKYAENHRVIREFVSEFGVKHFYDAGEGICHQVLPEMGHALPGTVVLGSDSHTTTHGAFGAFAAGIGRTEAAAIWATGELWLRVPETMRVELSGEFKPRVSAKDLALTIIGDIGSDGALYRAVEFAGDSAERLPMSERMVLCNMGAEMGAKNAYVHADMETMSYARSHAPDAQFVLVTSDPDAEYVETLSYTLDEIVPVVAKPHTVDNVAPVTDAAGTKVDQVVIGTCTNGRIEDLAAAADVLKGNKVAKGTRLLVFPASRSVAIKAVERGLVGEFLTAGAIWMNPNCGPCLGAHEGVLAAGEVCVSTSNRNFRGRMGSVEAEVYLSSPATAAACAVAGEIVDPREV
jgi:3-isopropylmalate/(R)-2-methylmalate dehydratase large subunit